MPHDITVGDVIEWRVEGVHTPTARRWNMVRHLICMEAPTDTEAENYDVLKAVATTLYNMFTGTFAQFLSEDWQFNLVRTKRIAPEQSVFALYADLTAGTFAGPVDEPDDAVVLAFYTNLPGRSFQGRAFVGGWPDDRVINGVIDAGIAQDFVDDAETFFKANTQPAGDLGQYRQGVFSPTRFAATGSALLSSALIQRVDVDRIMRRMTSREIQGREILGAEQA